MPAAEALERFIRRVDENAHAEALEEFEDASMQENQATPRVRELYGNLGYDIRLLDAPRRISCNGDRTPAEEILATRNV